MCAQFPLQLGMVEPVRSLLSLNVSFISHLSDVIRSSALCKLKQSASQLTEDKWVFRCEQHSCSRSPSQGNLSLHAEVCQVV